MTGRENQSIKSLKYTNTDVCPTSLILVPQVPCPGSAASHPREGDEPRLAAALLAVIPDLGAGVGAGPHAARAGGTADAGEGDQGGVLRPAPLIRVDIRA